LRDISHNIVSKYILGFRFAHLPTVASRFFDSSSASPVALAAGFTTLPLPANSLDITAIIELTTGAVRAPLLPSLARIGFS
jgi:hypothetical protein